MVSPHCSLIHRWLSLDRRGWLRLDWHGWLNLDWRIHHPADSLRYARSYDMAGKLVADEQETPNVTHTLRTTANDYAQFIVATMMKQGSAEQTALLRNEFKINHTPDIS